MNISRRILLAISLCFIFAPLFGFSIYATDGNSDYLNFGDYIWQQEDKESDDFVEENVKMTTEVIDYFELTNADLRKMVEANEMSTYMLPTFKIYELENQNKELLKDLGSLRITTGFARSKVTTFSKTKYIEGFGIEGTIIGLYVFHYKNATNLIDESIDKQLVVTQDDLIELGASGLYSETINLNYIGSNYVLLTIKEPISEKVVYRLYNVYREEAIKRELLENVNINFFEEEVEGPTFKEFVPKIIDFGL